MLQRSLETVIVTIIWNSLPQRNLKQRVDDKRDRTLTRESMCQGGCHSWVVPWVPLNKKIPGSPRPTPEVRCSAVLQGAPPCWWCDSAVVLLLGKYLQGTGPNEETPVVSLG